MNMRDKEEAFRNAYIRIEKQAEKAQKKVVIFRFVMVALASMAVAYFAISTGVN
jgi:hypothetical protein